MFASSRSGFLAVLFTAIFISPIAVGVFDALPYALVVIALAVFASYAFGSAWSRPKQVSLVLLSICFTLTLSDLAARPLLLYLYGVRPAERYIHPWPPLPQLHRYEAGVDFVGMTYGDLAAVSGRVDWREWRQIRFVTDEHGFRNEPLGSGSGVRPLDLIVLGDSFGVATGTSQEEILSNLLRDNYGLSVYNLSVSRENPQQEYANLLIEGNRLNTREGTCVLWLIFQGNDLDESYYSELQEPRPVTPGLLARLAGQISEFRTHSPVRALLTPNGASEVLDRTFVDGRQMLFNESYARRRSRTAEDVMRHPNFEHFKETFDAMERLSEKRRLSIAVTLVPSKEEVYGWVLDGGSPWSTRSEPSGFSTVLRGLCERHGFSFLDVKPPLVEASRLYYEKSGALLWWLDDTHWNGDGQRAAAAAISEKLLRSPSTP